VPGQTIVGHVTRVLHFGAFVDLGNGIEGLLHSSEMPAEGSPEMDPGDELTLRVVSLDVERQRVGLSLQELAGEQKQPDDVEAAITSETPEVKDENEPKIMSAIDETAEEYPQ
jgi:small subunit ribosomal protein S1